MNATIQEIEGIDDYWGPAFRSVYEGEGHEAFVQQLDERIVQHDKEIEKLCNFHYQPKKRKKQRRPRKANESDGVSNFTSEDHCSLKVSEHHIMANYQKSSGNSHWDKKERHYRLSEEVVSSYNSNNSKGPKRRCMNPSRLGDYTNVFPEASSTRKYNQSPSLSKDFEVARVNDDSGDSCSYDSYTVAAAELDESNANNDWEMASGISCEEYEEIAEYHEAEHQKRLLHTGITPVHTSDLRLYLRNRNRDRDLSSERQCGQIRAGSVELPHERRSLDCLNESDPDAFKHHHRSRREVFDERQRSTDCNNQIRTDSAERQYNYKHKMSHENLDLDNGTVSSHHKGKPVALKHHHRSHREVFDDRQRSTGRNNTVHGDYAEYQYNDRRQTSARFEGSHCDDSHGGLGIGLNNEYQPSYETECQYNPSMEKPEVNSPNDLRLFLKSRSVAGDDQAGNGILLHASERVAKGSVAKVRRRRRRNRRGNGDQITSSHDATNPIENNLDHLDTAERQHRQSRLGSTDNRPMPTEDHIERSYHDSTKLHHDESRPLPAELHFDQNRPMLTEDHMKDMSQIRHNPTESYHFKRSPISAEDNTELRCKKPTERHPGQGRPISSETLPHCWQGRLHEFESQPSSAVGHAGFIDSIRELLDVRSHAEELHAEISNVDANVKETTEGICTKAEELIRARRVELNIAATIEKMELCLPLLTTYSKLKSQVEAKRYYPALKTLEQLEHVLLPRVGPYKWCGTISADIPRLRQSIRDASMADLRDFLENIRKLSPQVGAMALKRSQEMMGRNLAAIVKNKKDKIMLSTDEIEAASQCPHELVDFSPLHRCLHIHTVLGAKNDFIQYYRAQRKQQARLVLIPASSNLHDSIRGVKDYLNAVLGFFILEEHLLSAAAGLVSKDWLLDTWSMSVTKVASTLRTNTSLITDPTLMLSIKHQIVLFINTVKCYGLPVEPLPTLLQEMAEHYTEVLMQRWVAVFRDILDKAAFTPIEVQNEEEYDDVVNNFPYDASDLEMQPFPKSFPFSSIVPSVYLQVKEFIYAWLKYSVGLGLGGGRRAAAARHSASLLLSRSFTGCLSALFHSPLPLMQLVQIIVDTQYLEDATVCLYEFISNITGSGPVSTQPVAGLFQSARDEAEQQICDNLQKKVDEFLDLENYDWLLVEPTGQASSFVTDMISYLKGVMESLHQLPEQARVAAVRAATNRIAVRLRSLLLEPAVRQISSGALYQLDLDVMQCEQFAASEPVTGLKENELLDHFASLRQLLDLITGWDWSSYLHDVGIEGGKYALVTPRDAATLLEKFKEAEQKSSVFSVLKKNERDKRKLLDTVLKQLKQLQNQDGS